MTTRREFMASIPAGAAAVGLAGAAASRQTDDRTLYLFSPADAVVISINEGSVVGGTKVMELRSPWLERLDSRIAALSELISIVRRPLDDGHVDDSIQAIEADLAASEQMEKVGLEWLNYAQGLRHNDSEQLRRNGWPMRKIADEIRITAKFKHLESTIKSKHALLSKRDAESILTLLEISVQDERIYADRYRTALSVTTPVQGSFVSVVLPGSFVSRGSQIGTLQAQGA